MKISTILLFLLPVISFAQFEDYDKMVQINATAWIIDSLDAKISKGGGISIESICKSHQIRVSNGNEEQEPIRVVNYRLSASTKKCIVETVVKGDHITNSVQKTLSELFLGDKVYIDIICELPNKTLTKAPVMIFHIIK